MAAILSPFTTGGASFTATGLTGATAASRYVGATASGAPGSGTFLLGDFIVDQSGAMWVCTTAGSPGTWTQVGSSIAGNQTVVGSVFATFGNFDASLAGTGLKVAEGSNAKQGTAVLNGTTAVVVSNTSVTANSRIFLTIQSPNGTPAGAYVSARSAGTSFSIKSFGASDTSTVAYEIIEPG